jgi:CubicO group peptidase (beta-lactamase class C family)
VSLGVDAQGEPIQADSLFALTSTSKLALALLVLRLVEDGELEIDGELALYLPRAAAAAINGVTIRRLLSHTSGLPLEVRNNFSSPPGTITWDPDLRWPGALASACLETELSTPPGVFFQYSNVGYGLLALAAERITGSTSATLIEERIAAPLGIELYLGRPTPRPPIALVDVPGPHSGTSLDPYTSRTAMMIGFPWRGMFSNIDGLLALVRAYCEDSSLISADTARLAQADQAGGLPGGYRTTEAFLGIGKSRKIVWDSVSWGLGIEVQGGKEPHWAPSSLPDSWGQIGSSGCLAWYDTKSSVAWAIAGARTTEKGWLVRHGTRIAKSAIQSADANSA